MNSLSQNRSTQKIGIHKDEIDTPTLCVDLDAMQSNIQSMANICRRNNIDWRPHSKCHKSPAIAQMLIDAGAIGVTCAKLGEAEVMAAGGIKDLLIANLIVGPQKIDRLVRLRRQADPIVCIDHLDQAGPLAAAMSDAALAIRVIVEIDLGLNRVGVAPGQATVDLAERLQAMPGLNFAGIMGYEGHLLTVEDPQEKQTAITAALTRLTDTKDQLIGSGLDCPIVSAGGTGSYPITAAHEGITELQAGGAIFMDAFYRHACQIDNLRYALLVTTTIVGRPAPDRAIIDAGRKTLNAEVYNAQIADRDDIQVDSLSAEHGTLRLEESAQDLRIGDRLEMIPGYGDLTIFLHDEMLGFRDNRLEIVWPIVGRGKLR